MKQFDVDYTQKLGGKKESMRSQEKVPENQ